MLHVDLVAKGDKGERALCTLREGRGQPMQCMFGTFQGLRVGRVELPSKDVEGHSFRKTVSIEREK